jgi:hypothetical protein
VNREASDGQRRRDGYSRNEEVAASYCDQQQEYGKNLGARIAAMQ